MSSNIYSVLDIDDENGEHDKKEQHIGKEEKRSWADITDDEETGVEERNDNVKSKDKKIVMSAEEAKAWREFDNRLSKLDYITITHNVRKFDKENKVTSTIINERKLKVVSKASYENLKNLITKFKTHSKNKFNFNEQKSKIEVSNQLLQWCYKDNSIQGCFVYPVAIINTNNGKTITRNEIFKGSNSEFYIRDLTFYPPFDN
jgi:hypothetical protein